MARCSSLASRSSITHSAVPSLDSITRPYPVGSSASKAANAIGAFVSRRAATTSRINAPVMSGVSPQAMSSSFAEAGSAASAQRTASAVPSGFGCSAIETLPPSSSASPAVAGESTTTDFSVNASAAAATTQPAIGRPSSWCSTLGTWDCIRDPTPAARMMAVTPSRRSGPRLDGLILRRRLAWRSLQSLPSHPSATLQPESLSARGTAG